VLPATPGAALLPGAVHSVSTQHTAHSQGLRRVAGARSSSAAQCGHVLRVLYKGVLLEKLPHSSKDHMVVPLNGIP